MSAFTQTLTRANGTAIPQLGFGTWMPALPFRLP